MNEKTGRALHWAAVAMSLVVSAACAADDDERRRYTFSWPFSPGEEMQPRGGTTTGASVQLTEGASPEWDALHEPSLPQLERDRRAIRAMTGGYRTTFDFLETAGFTPGYEPARPYQSWATEYIFSVAEEPHFISLQHVIVMLFVDDAGDVQGPFVQKHWRQDWRYEDTRLTVYDGLDRWRQVELDPAEAAGRWSQAVFQVDDSPRYASIGDWTHAENYSAWMSEETWRPLPRRESSVRDDYDVLIGTNRHTITPTGWVHEEDNLKVDLDDDGERRAVLAREVGLNRYERVVGFDFSSAEEYWRLTGAFWSDVRAAWRDVLEEHDAFELAEAVDGRALFVPMFEYAEGLASGRPYDVEASRRFVRETLERYVDQ